MKPELIIATQQLDNPNEGDKFSRLYNSVRLMIIPSQNILPILAVDEM